MSIYSTKDFIGKPAPPNYVAGLGRGATGFTTRSDLGPARDDSGGGGGEEVTERGGENEEGLFGTGPYDEDDEEADRIYAAIEEKMDERRRVRREAREREDLERLRRERPKIHEQFSDLKRGLSVLSAEEWANIPEPGDMLAVGRKMRKMRDKERERVSAVSDSFLLGVQSHTQLNASVDPMTLGLNTPLVSPSGGGGSAGGGQETLLADFRQISKARDDLLRVKLDQAGSDSVSGQTTVDPKGYLTDLNSIVLKTDAEIGDIKKARELLKSVTLTNPKHAPGWIAAARLEEIDGKIGQARSVIARGCEECPKNEDVWLEAARLNTPENAKIILANAVREVPQAAPVWLKAAKLETEAKAKKKVLRKALEFIPDSLMLWKAAIDLEDDPEDARIMLSRAVECVPLSVELWLALARLETFENAQKVLNRARAACPQSHEIWVAAARLADSAGEENKVRTVVTNAIRALSKVGTNLSREKWLEEAEKCEKAGNVTVCQEIVRATIGQDVDPDDRQEVWLDDAENCAARGSIATARAIYVHALREFVHEDGIWQQAAFFEKEHGSAESLDELLKRAVGYCPQSEVLWLMRAKEKWMGGDVQGAREVLSEAFRANSNSEQVWLAAAKLEVESGELDRGRQLLNRAREQASSPRIWLKAILLERNLDNVEGAKALLERAMKLYPNFAKFWLIKGQIEENQRAIEEARATFTLGVKQCPKCIPLWLCSSRLEEAQNSVTRARAILDKARLINPKCPELWLETVRVEVRAKNSPQARTYLSRALQECPQSGILWSEAVILEPRPSRPTKSIDALRKCENDATVLTTAARLFWSDRKVDKARSWLNRSLGLNSDLGDTWAWLYKFESQYGTEEQRTDVVRRCVAADPHHGEYWQPVAKHPLNWSKPVPEILVLVAAALPEPM